MDLLSFDAADLAVSALVALVTLGVAGVVLAADPKRGSNLWLAFFLLLISGNFLAQAAVKTVDVLVADGAVDAARGAALHAAWESAGVVFLVLDPLALVYFASLFPRRSGVAERPWGVAGMGAVALLFLAAEIPGRRLSAPADALDAPRILLFAWLAACYLYASWRIVRNLLTEPSTVMADQVRVVGLGVLVAAVPRVALLPSDLAPSMQVLVAGAVGPGGLRLLDLGLRVLLLTACWIALRRTVATSGAVAERRREAAGMLRVVGLVFLVFAALWTVERLLRAYHEGVAPLPEAAGVMEALSRGMPFAVRWFVFSAAIVYGVVRYQAFAVHADALTWVGGACVTAVAAVVVGLTASTAGPWAAAVLAAVVVGAAFAGAGGVTRLRADRAASAGFLHERGLEVYRAMLAAALAEGPLTPERKEHLARARGRLGVGAREHDMLLAFAELEESGGARQEVLGRYVLLKRLGAGGSAVVHLAHDRETERLVVVKRIREEWAGTRGALDAALRELEVARRVSHPRVVAVHDMVRTDDGAIVVMEYVEGGSLADLLAREGRLPSARVAALADDILAGLEAVHEGGVVHGDLKPGNVLLDAEGRVKLADFGAARSAAMDRTLVRGTAAPGTVLYMSPEQARGERPTALSDVYAVGALAYEALTGLPHAGGGQGPYDALRRIVAPAAGDRAPFPAGWETVLARALATAPEARFRSAHEMRAAVAALRRVPEATHGE